MWCHRASLCKVHLIYDTVHLIYDCGADNVRGLKYIAVDVLRDIFSIQLREILAVQDYPKRGLYDVTFTGTGIFLDFIKKAKDLIDYSRDKDCSTHPGGDPNGGGMPPFCRFCKKYGHEKENCVATCPNCASTEHFLEECPMDKKTQALFSCWTPLCKLSSSS
ncbi:hypothetical protein XELAEV_18040117mg [Xenopus laevis]|uniref:Zinc finger CCHC domain-containing protein n=1 Tax=Xenopus laevis TaxID=8355 RepID=A0A974H902_XENLA|nr:hypothetical protein XELAEV_18040117mg [Xenopus laevis]